MREDYKVPFGEYVYQINVCGPLMNAVGECNGKGACQTKPSDKSFLYNAGQLYASAFSKYAAWEV